MAKASAWRAPACEGTLRIPKEIVHKLPATLSVRVSILNANGKAYAIDKVYRLGP